MAYFWPGLPHVWRRGSWAGLALACGFGLLFDALATATWVWKEWFPPQGLAMGWCALGVLWALAYAEARADLRRLVREWASRDGLTPDQRSQSWYRAAQVAYLLGDWSATESHLSLLLHHDPRDIEARLFLATLKRRQGDGAAARRHLEQLSRWEAAARWNWEIAYELAQTIQASVSLHQATEGGGAMVASAHSATAKPDGLPQRGAEVALGGEIKPFCGMSKGGTDMLAGLDNESLHARRLAA